MSTAMDRAPGPASVPSAAPASPGAGGHGPESADVLARSLHEDETDVDVASQWRLVWWRFRRHKVAVASAVVVAALYAIALFAPFLAPFSGDRQDGEYTYAPPQPLRVSAEGLYVLGYQAERDPESLALVYEVDETQRIPVRLFDRGEPYELFGIVPTDIHLIGPVDDTRPMYLLGTNDNGEDLFSRIILGSQVSLSIGLVGVAVSLVLGIIIGGVSGYFGGVIDTVIQRVIEFLMSIPSIPLWMGLAAAVPRDWGPLERYFAITVLLSVIGWTSLARVVRGRFLSLREEDFVLAARLDGSSQARVIFRHILPSFTSHVIASVTLAIPAMILGETALSFLGLGLQAPVVSWGVLLQEAQNVRALQTAPWLLASGAAVFVSVLALNFLGDGLRDAADPYG
ncbi:MAG: ABC transporter permease [Kineosporiaceae bacterium]